MPGGSCGCCAGVNRGGGGFACMDGDGGSTCSISSKNSLVQVGQLVKGGRGAISVWH